LPMALTLLWQLTQEPFAAVWSMRNTGVKLYIA
jgi:hypothetical protein